MPRYQYRCRDCGQDLEVVQSFHDDPLTVCPNCEGGLRKVFTPIGIAFKGSGFYKTDNRSGQSSRSSGNGGKTSDSDTSDSGGSDSSGGSGDDSSSSSGSSEGSSSGREAASTSTN